MTDLDRIHRVLDAHGKLRASAATVGDDDDLYAAGMTSHASVNVMLGLEDEFGVEFPDELLTKATFCTVRSMAAAVTDLMVSV